MKPIVPQEILRDRSSWVVWKKAQRPGKTRPDKIPFNPKTGKTANTVDPTSWGTYDDAQRALNNGCEYDGLGIVFTGDGLAGIDLDGCRDPHTGEIATWALEIVNEFSSYSEISPSDTGLHILFESNFRHKGFNAGGLEIYTSGRFFTFTGKVRNRQLNPSGNILQFHILRTKPHRQ